MARKKKTDETTSAARKIVSRQKTKSPPQKNKLSESSREEERREKKMAIRQNSQHSSRMAWFAYGIGVCLLLAIASLGGYGFYMLQEKVFSFRQEYGMLTKELSELRNQIDVTQRLNRQNLHEKLEEAVRERKEQEEIMHERIQSLSTSFSAVDPQLMRQQQLQQLIYLAEQQRLLNAEPRQILSLLSSAHSIALNHRGAASVSLIQALARDIQAYQSLAVLPQEDLVHELDTLLERIHVLPRFPTFQAGDEETFSPSPENPYLDSLRDLFTHLKDYVRIYKAEGMSAGFLTEEEKRLIDVILTGKLVQAQFALLQKDVKLFRTTLANLAALIERYYPFSQERTALMEHLADLMERGRGHPELPILQSAEILAY